MGFQDNRPTPIVYNPGAVYFRAGLLLCLTFGLTLAGINESLLARHWGWLVFFSAGELGVIALYFWIVWSWLRWMDQTAEYDPVFPEVFSDRECDEHQGEQRDS